MTPKTNLYKAYDLPCRTPVAEHLTEQEASRFKSRGFKVLPMDEGLAPTEEELKQLIREHQRRLAAEVLSRSRPGTAAKPGSTTR